MNSPNAAPRSIHDLCRMNHDALGIDTQSHAKPEMLWYHLLRFPEEFNMPITKDHSKRRSNHKLIWHEPNNQREESEEPFNEVWQFVLGSEGEREILLINQLYDTIHRDNPPLYIARESLKKRKPTGLNLDQKWIHNHIRNPEHASGRPEDRPLVKYTESQFSVKLLHISWSAGRSTDSFCCCCFL